MNTERIGKYRLIAQLGQGGMASVFLATAAGPIGFNKLLVLKVLKEDLSRDPDFLAMFVNEARVAARLNHANVVQTFEVGFEDGQHFLAMDFLDGQPMHFVLSKVTRPLMPLDLHVRILADVLAGLHYAHTLSDFDGTPLRVVHRDVSPQNVFVTYDGQVKLVDFGIAKAAGASTNTQSGVFKGKLAYVAPEQAGGDPVDARADIFSVGIMLWEAMAGRRFATKESQTTVLARRLAGTEPRIRDQVPDADPELADICDRAMAHRPDDRFQTAQDFRDALEAFLDRFSRRVASREVSELMTRLFADERDRIRSIIDQQMKQLMRETSQSLPLLNIEMSPGMLEHTPSTTEGGRRPVPPAAASQGGLMGAGAQPPIATESTPGSVSGNHGTLVAANLSGAPPRSAKNTALLVAFGALAVTTLLGLVLFLTWGRAEAPRAATPPSASAPPEASAAPVDRIQLAITFGPPPATAKLDGVPLSHSPFSAQVPRDGSMHRLEVEAPGFVSKTTMLSFDRDIALDIVLEKETAPVETTPAVPPPPPPKGPVVGATPPPPPPPGGKQPLQIDEEDPYKK